MNLIDSSAWLEYFAGGPPAQHVAAAIEDIERVLVPTIVLLEVTRPLAHSIIFATAKQFDVFRGVSTCRSPFGARRRTMCRLSPA